MSHRESPGKSDEWYTPKYIFDALGVRFDMDVSAPEGGPLHVPCDGWLWNDSLSTYWVGFVWMNPPFGGRNAIEPWLAKFFVHGSGIALTPDRTSAPWFRRWAPLATSLLFLPKIRFLRPDGSEGISPSNGTVLMAAGMRGHAALINARALGVLVKPLEIAA